MKLKLVHMNVNPKDHVRAKRLAKYVGTSTAEIYRIALNEYLAAQENVNAKPTK